MIVEWTSTHIVEFEDEVIEEITNVASRKHWDRSAIIDAIENHCQGWDDCDYYALTDEAIEQVLHEIQQRLGGYQLSMFDKENMREKE